MGGGGEGGKPKSGNKDGNEILGDFMELGWKEKGKENHHWKNEGGAREMIISL